LDVDGARIHALGEWDVLPVELGLAHVDGDASVAFAHAVEKAATGPERHAAVAGFLEDEARDAACAVAAALDLIAVRIPDAHLGVGAIFWTADDEHLVVADAAVAVADQACSLRRHRDRVLAGIDDDEVVAEAVHLEKGHVHGRGIYVAAH